MTRIAPDPLAGVEQLVVDGSNLLHAMRREGGPAPAAALVGRLRGAVPAEVAVEVVFDGAPGGPAVQRAASGVFVRFSGRRPADALILELARPEGMLVVTDDRDLRERLRARGTATARTAWLVGRLERVRLAAPMTGNRRPRPAQPGGSTIDEIEDDGRPGWKPGRGATVKRGNPKRGRPGPRRPGT